MGAVVHHAANLEHLAALVPKVRALWQTPGSF
jgi:hypothetical protein